MPTNSFAHLLKSTPFYTWVRAGVSAHYFLTAGAETATKKWGDNSTIVRCRRQCIEVRSADQSARSAKKHFAFIFQLSESALVVPSCFALQVRDASPQETR